MRDNPTDGVKMSKPKDESDDDQKPPTPTFLQKIIELKEILGIATAAVGAITFSLGYFVSQSHYDQQSRSLQCFLAEQISILNEQIVSVRSEYHLDKFALAKAQLEQKRLAGMLNHDDSATLVKLEESYAELRDAKGRAQAQRTAAEESVRKCLID